MFAQKKHQRQRYRKGRHHGDEPEADIGRAEFEHRIAKNNRDQNGVYRRAEDSGAQLQQQSKNERHNGQDSDDQDDVGEDHPVF